MSDTYYIAAEADLRCNPNYSFEIGDVDGDGQLEMVALNQAGNRLRVMKLDGSLLLERHIRNNGNWGTLVPTLLDVDGDGRHEVIVPSAAPDSEARVIAVNADNEVVAEHSFGTVEKDDYGITVPLLGTARLLKDQPPCLLSAVAGGHVVALDSEFNELWRRDDMRHDFAHEFFFYDLDDDGLDEIVFCTTDNQNVPFSHDGRSRGDLVILDHDGSTIYTMRVDDLYPDTHFDDIAIADFRGIGKPEILTEKGVLIDFDGNIIWNVSDQFDHGQWIAHAKHPDGSGERIFITELHGVNGKSAIFTGHGEKIADITHLPRTVLDPVALPGWSVETTRCHTVRWTPDDDPQFFFAEQTVCPTSHDSFHTRPFILNAFFIDLDGNLIGSMPYEDAQIENYWYNGEVRSRVADVDGDGIQEIVLPRQDGHVMVIKKKE